MRLSEVLETYSYELNEVDISKVNDRLEKHRDDARSARELANMIKGDAPLEQSLERGITGSAEDMSKYTILIDSPKISQAIESLPSQLANLFKTTKKEAASKASDATAETPSLAKDLTQDPLKGVDKETKSELNTMQQQWLGAKTPQERNRLLKTWLENPVKSRLYKFGKKEGLF